MKRGDIANRIGINIKIARCNMGLSQKELAKTMKVAWKTLYQWERGDAVPSVVKLYKLAKFLDMFMCELIDIKNRKDDILLKGIEEEE